MRMYRHLDSLLEKAKKKLRTEFNRLGLLGFDELNVVNTKKITKAMFDRLLSENEKMYQKAADKAYSKAKRAAKEAGYREEEEKKLGGDWLIGVLLAYNFVTGYVYDREAERKRLRLNEQILTAREYGDRQLLNSGLQRTANLWWTQTQQYGVDVVDKATLRAYEDMGVKRVRWKARIDGRECKVCRERHDKIFEISKVPEKTHYNCRCYLEPVKTED
jgi:SPP1 gp7 family putative phage head morphogenesis protein